MKNINFIFIFLLFFSGFFPVVADDSGDIQSLTDEREETLRYGIDSEVISLLNTLEDEEDKNLADIIAEVYDNSSNSSVLDAAVKYFIKIEYSDAYESAENRLKNWEDIDYSTLTSSLRYISTFYRDDSESIILPLVDHENKLLASAALTALGKCGTELSADTLLDYLDDDDYPEELKPVIIKSLGEMKSEKAVDVLLDILEDVDEEKSWRWNACEALGNIGDKEALPVIRQALQDDDTYLRSYAVKALAGFDDESVEDTLIQSLRDSFWRVRVSAAEALGERESKNAVDILIYKAKKDPENNVKLAAVEALGKIGDRTSMDFLRELYGKNTASQSVRTKAAEIIIENDIDDSIDFITTLLAAEWEKDKSAVLGYTCKFLSKAEHPGLEPLFEQMLNHKDVAVKIYGIRGISLNKFTSLKSRIDELTEEGINNAVRKAALSASEEL